MTTILKSESFVEAFSILPLLGTLDAYYPNITDWYVNTVIPGLVTGSDVLLVARDEGSIVGFCLGKQSFEEKKLRCIRVLPSHQNTGIGLRLIERMFDHLETDKPHCTVAEELFPLYSRSFINRYGFQLNRVDKGQYRRGKLEYAFN